MRRQAFMMQVVYENTFKPQNVGTIILASTTSCLLTRQAKLKVSFSHKIFNGFRFLSYLVTFANVNM